MKHEEATEEIQEVAALYALGALSQHEARAFEVHLREGCPICETELSQQEGVSAELGLAAPELAPPPYLRELLVARLERETRPAAPAAPASPEPAPAVDAIIPKSGPSAIRLYLPWAIAASFAILFVLSYRWTRQIGQEIALQQERLTGLQEEAEQLKSRLDQERFRAQELEQIRSVLTSPGSRVILLAGLEAAPTASAAVLWDTQRNRWLVTANLPPPAAGKVYQLWFITPDARVSAGLIRTDVTGRSFTVVDVPSAVQRRLAATAITLEPEGGSEQPTMPIYALGRVG